MSIIHRFKRWILKLYIWKMRFPKFHDTELVRQRVTYTGKVQRVGFRDEVRLIAERIGITGHVRNMGENTVIAELQGTPDRLEALKQAIRKEKRFSIEHINEQALDCIPGEAEFCIVG